MPSSRREKVDIASTIKHILDSYFGKAILRELIQNSDDAGAKKQIFILDSRQYGVESVVDKEFRKTQGASLLAVNDSVFKPADWDALVTPSEKPGFLWQSTAIYSNFIRSRTLYI